MTVGPPDTRVGRTPIETDLAQLWLELLGCEPMGVEDDFFCSGGDSILAARFVARVSARFGVDVPLEAFVEEPRIAAFAKKVQASRPKASAHDLFQSIDGRPSRCSFAQERFWFIDQASDEGAVANVAWALRLHGPIDAGALERALAEVVARHESLRTRFAVEEGHPVQLVEVAAEPTFRIADVSREEDPEDAVARLVEEEAHRPFDLGKAPLLRAQIVRVGEKEHVLQFVAHHIVCDDWSKGIIHRELADLYAADVAGEASELPAPPVQYSDYADWHRSLLDDHRLDEELVHWSRQLEGAPAALELSPDRPRPPVPSQSGARLRAPVPLEVAEALRALGRGEGATFFMTMLAAFDVLLHRYTGEDDLVVGTAIDNRGRIELEDMIGLFTNVLALRVDVSGSPTFRDVLRRVRSTTVDAISHQELPFDRLAAAMPERDASRHPIFQIFYEFIVPSPVELPLPGVRVEPFDVRKRTTEFDLGLYLDESGGSLDAVWEYSTDLFDSDTVERLARHFVVLLQAIVAEPDRPIAELPLLDAAERERVVVQWNATAVDVPPARIEELFEEQVRRTPDLPAIAAAGDVLSYSELNEQANRLAHFLRSVGVAAGDAVGLCVDRSQELIVALLGIVKAGAAYVPLNADHPSARLERQLRDASARVLLTQTAVLPESPAFDGEVYFLDEEGERLAGQPTTDPERLGTPDDLVYVLYTSGSTGVPKGVAVRHRNLVNYTTHMLSVFGDGGPVEGWQFASVSAISTDLGNTTIFPSLLGGGCLHVVGTDASTDGELFAEYVAVNSIDVLKITPSHLRTLLDASGGRPIVPRQWLVTGGESATWDLVERVACPGGPRILNHYGPTEATVGCCTFEIDPQAVRPLSATVPIGRPISNVTAYVLDRLGAPVPPGLPGELYVGGAGIARGYVAQPEETAKLFVPDRFSDDPDARLYKTGDVVRLLPDGSLEFFGRADQQVKIRGFRVEPGEVEAALLQQDGVRQAVVLPQGEGDDKFLAAFVVGDTGSVMPEAVRAGLAEILPAYMIPATVVALDALPLTPNGKVDRRALLALPAGEDEAAAAKAAPVGELEEQLVAIWAELLGREGIGVDENFFEAGGHSLLAIRLIARLRTDFDVKLQLKALIDEPTIRGLAGKIDDARGVSSAEEAPQEELPPLVVADRDRPLRSSFAQEQFWLVDRLTPDSAAYNFSWPMDLRGPLDVQALEHAVAAVVQRHEALRARFVVDDGQPMQVADAAGDAALLVVDLSGEHDPAATAKRLVDEQTRAPFDLERGPLLRVQLLRLGEEQHVLQIVVHHIVFDGVSKVVLFRDLGAFYAAFSEGRQPSLPDLSVQYADYAEWQREWLHGPWLERELAHWRQELEGIPEALELPTDRPRPPVASLRGARRRTPVRSDLRAGLEELARKEGATFFMVMLAAFDVLLSRYTGQEDVVVGAPVDIRGRPELENVIGPFLNTVVLRNDLSGAPTFRELLARVRHRTLDAVAHQELPFERLVAALQPDRDLSRHPIFQALLALNPPEISLELPGIDVEDIEPEWSTARVDLFLILDDLPRGLEAVWEYSTDLFDAETIEGMERHFIRLLEEVVADPGRPITELPLLSENEWETLREWNGSEVPIPQGRLEELVAVQAAATPERVAVEFEGATLTYAELDARANRLAHHLRGLGVEPEEPVGVCLRRSAELLVALLGILKSGGAYVPVDPAYPEERQQFMFEDAQVRVIVTEEDLLTALPASDAAVLCLDRDAARLAAQPADSPLPVGDAEALAYVIYTSGSTGTPKGVEIPHRAVVNFLTSMRERPGLHEDDVLVAVTTLSFDIAGLELFLPLVTGARVVIAPEATTGDPRSLRELIESSGATVMQATPTTWRMLVDAGWSGKAGLKVLCGGEALPRALADELLDRGVELWNMYGPTETTIWSSIAPVTTKGAPLTIGRPIANTSLFVLDGRLQPLPVGVSGEVYIGGAGVARGYKHRPDLTAERFVPDPFDATPGARLYRTGDLGRYRRDGSIEFLGRLDQQVKVRGFRIELAEIETRLARHPSVAAAVAATHAERPGENSLVAYVVPTGEPPSAAELRRFLEESLPAYMVPSSIVTLDAFPLTPNGKVDRKRLPVPAEGGVVGAAEHVEPRNEGEALLAGIFAELLGRERVGVEDDFFELGGHSLLAARLIGRVGSELGIELPLRALFEQPTIAGLAVRVEEARGLETREEPPPLVPIARMRRSSFAQERFWFMDQFAGATGAYNISWPLRLRGPLDVQALERALTELVRRHEALRTRFAVDDGLPVQVVDPRAEVVLELVDLRSDPEHETTARRLVDEQTIAPFDLERGPLIRTRLLRLDEEHHVLQIVVHHIAADGWSKTILFRDLGALYAGFVEGRVASLPELALQYGDYAEWQRSWLQGERLEQELAHWLGELRGAPAALELPTDRPRPAAASMRGAWSRSSIDGALVDALTGLARAEGATFFMVMLAAFDVLLYRYTGEEDVVVGAPVDGRTRPELEGIVGPFVNTVVLRNDLSGTPTFRELLARVRQRTLDAVSHQDLPFERLVEALQPERDLGRHPIFQALLSLNPPESPLDLPGFEIEELTTEKTEARTDLTLILQQRESGLDAVWEYSTDLFEPETIERMERHFGRLLEGIVADPDRPITGLPILDDVERSGLLEEWNDQEAEFAVGCLHELYETRAAGTPDAIAVSYEGASLTYRELNERANRLAHRLRALGVGPETPVALCLERSLELVVAILAVLKAGGGYVPLDPDYPAERLAFVLADTQAPVLLTQEQVLARLPTHKATVLCLDRDAPLLAQESADDLVPLAGPENLAYIIYTSGSTGQPKGVQVEHRNVVRLFTATDKWFAFGPDDVWSLLHSYAFDFSVWELWGALLYGGRLVVVPQWTTRSPDALAALLADEQVTVLNATPSLFLAALDEFLQVGDRLSLRFVVFGGEALRPALLRPWFDRFEDRGPMLVNMYGITETTVHVTYRPLSAADVELDSSPIGRPIPDLELYLLDEELEPVPLGVAGELFVGGAGVARGYLNRPELTAERFLPNPFGSGRLYRTGDRARRLSDGSLEFHGRSDDQVKIRGFRIELGEIEAALREHEAVAESAVVAYNAGPGDTRLAAYVVPDETRAGVVRRLLRLEREERLESERCRELPNGMVVAHVNQTETDYLYDEIFARESYLRNGIVVPQDACVFDVGANIGLFSLLVGQISPNARIFAFEPIPPVFDLLRLNVELYGLDAVLFDCGLADGESTATFTYLPRNSLVSGRFVDLEEEREVVRRRLAGRQSGNHSPAELAEDVIRERLTSEVFVRPLQTLSHVIAEHGIDRIDLLKIDAEKSEWNILEGLGEDDWPKIRQIVLEVHGGGDKLEQIVESLEEHSYTVVVEQDQLPTRTGLYDHTVYARRGHVEPAVRPTSGGWQSGAGLRADLRSWLKQKLPEYMVPSSFTLLEALPLTVNGKLDRKSLPAPEHHELPEAEFLRARTGTEQAVADVWTQLLGLERVSVDDNFFELGGHSLLAAQLAARVSEGLGVTMSVRTVFEEPTVAGLAAQIDAQRTAATSEEVTYVEDRIGRAPRTRSCPLSYGQHQLWFLEQWRSGMPTYNLTTALRLRGQLDLDAVRGSLEEVVARHEALRTVFQYEDGEPVQIVREDWAFELPVVDVSQSGVDPEAEARKIVDELLQRPFDLSADLLLRATLIRTSEAEHVLVVQSHHIAFDGWSESIVFGEIGELYTASREGRLANLAEPPIQYRDFTQWQRQYLGGGVLEEKLDYWRAELAGAPTTLRLPTDRPRPESQTFVGSNLFLTLPQSIADGVRELAPTQGATPYMVLLAAFAALLYRRGGQDDILVGGPFANRGRPELERLVGFVANTVVVRARLGGNPTFSELLRRIREGVLGAQSHQETPFEQVVDAVRPQRDAGANPLFQVNFRAATAQTELRLPGLEIERLELDSGTSRFDLALDLQLKADGIGGYFKYNTDLFDRETIAGFATDFTALLSEALSRPDIRILSLELPSEENGGSDLADAAAPKIKRFRDRAN